MIGAAQSLTQISRALKERRLTAQALTEAMLARIAQLNARLNCYLDIAVDAALAAAARADRELDAGSWRGPLHGVPLAHKDIFRRAGRTASGGTKPVDPVVNETATVLQRLDDAGAVLLGALHLDELAAGGTGVNAHYGRCANPWAPAHITGGSSSGSAAAVAAGLAFGALASDAGGSTRLPAAYCGVVGLKPTYGRVSRFASLSRSFSMDSTGPIARSAEDCAILLEAIAGADPRDPTAASVAVPPYSDHLRRRRDLRGLRIGLAQGDGFADVAPDIARAIAASADVLRGLGATVQPVEIPDVALLNDLQQILVKCEAATLHGARLRHAPDSIGFAARSVIQEGLLIPATRYIEAQSLRAPLLERHVGLYREVDLVLAPVIPGPAPLAAALASDDSGAIEAEFTRGARFTRFANYLGTPALAVPCGLNDAGLPLAFQFLAPPFAESRLLVCAHLYGQDTGFAGRVAELAA